MRKPGLEPEHFEQQFHNQHMYADDKTGTITPWWEQDAPAYAAGGPVVDKALDISSKATKRGN